MRRFTRLNRSRVIIIFNDCTINGTGDLSIENEAEIDVEILEEQKPLVIRGALDALAQVLRPVAANALGALGVITRADLEALHERTMVLEEAKPAAGKPAGKAGRKPAKKAAKKPAKKASKKA
ncbi:MAG: hypothetical protein KKE79_06575 [Actinobacteria bacterium]|nr:hypothetical protein [Actinomycetota bacterium]MCG2794645.1 hypothetical protein [Actinomycetes bacterium]MBU4240084.1 hypothetical protein [Actinomycetota bacterium]MBU4301916.1 hypothetical protein [Actinomycetota bacterium]MBU4385821.1 hypothetical protein [Actinomycetota bacterium]